MTGMSEETERLAADLAGAGARLNSAAAAVLAKGALNVKNGWRQNASGMPHLPFYPASITYDIFSEPGHMSAEIGPDKAKKQGPLGNIAEFGTSKNPPGLHGARALADEEPRFYAALEDVAGSVVLP